MELVSGLRAFATNLPFQERWAAVKRAKKVRAAAVAGGGVGWGRWLRWGRGRQGCLAGACQRARMCRAPKQHCCCACTVHCDSEVCCRHLTLLPVTLPVRNAQVKLAALIKKIHGDEVNIDALFDIQVGWLGIWAHASVRLCMWLFGGGVWEVPHATQCGARGTS